MMIPLLSFSEAIPVLEQEPTSMSPNLVLAFVGGIIIAGFLGDLIFKVTKIPAVVKLMGIGLLIGPVLELVPGEEMQAVAPLFGKIALLIILFAGGLTLDLKTVVSQLGKAVLVAVGAFVITLGLVLPVALYVIKLDVIPAIILGTLVAGTASAIVIPVVNRLSVNSSMKTLLSIESALSNLFILVIVVIACDLSVEGANLSVIGIIGAFFYKIFMSVLAALVAGVLWARLIGAMRQESLSYMLTLGFLFLLNYIVDLLGGSGAISILFFAVILANVQGIAESVAPKLFARLGVQLESTNYALNEFMKNIAKELSFLVGTFFFVYLGVLVSFDDFTPDMLMTLGLIIAAIVVGRVLFIYVFKWVSKTKWTAGETILVIAMMPRGLATAVMSFKPLEAEYADSLSGTEMFPFFAMIGILGSNLIMTGLVAVGEAVFRKENKGTAENEEVKNEVDEVLAVEELEVSDKEKPTVSLKAEEEEEFLPFKERLFHWFRIKKDVLTTLDQGLIESIEIRNLIYWVMVVAASCFGTLGILMGKPEVLLAAMLFSPITKLLHTVSFAIISGDILVFFKGNTKLVGTVFITILISAAICWFTPLTGFIELEKEGIHPTVLDYTLSICIGLILPILVMRNRKVELLIITPILGLVLFPPIVAMGYGLATWELSLHFVPGTLGFAANFTALSLGSILTLWIFGFNDHPVSETFRKWKLDEVKNGILAKFYGRFRLQRLLGTAGNFYARAIVVAIMAIALFVPLQLTINRLGEDHMVHETIQDMAHEFFDVPGRSGVIAIKTNNEKKLTSTRIQVLTDAYFSANDREEFERKCEAILGKPVQLQLDQLASEKNTVNGGQPLVIGGNFQTLLEDLKAEFLAVGDDIEGGNAISMTILSYHIEYSPYEDNPLIYVDFLKDGGLSPDAAVLVRQDVAKALNLPVEEVFLQQAPNVFQADSLDLNALAAENTHLRPIDLLEHFSNLKAVLSLPNTLEPDSLAVVAARLRGEAKVLNDHGRVTIEAGEKTELSIRLF